MPGTLRQISRSHVISRFPPDLLPSLHKVTQMRHTFRQKTLILSLLELPVEDYAHFYMLRAEPRGPTELLKNAEKRFQIGLVFPEEGDTNTKICSASRKRVVFSKGTL